MKCQDYIFLLTSEQLTTAGLAQSTSAKLHRLVCKHCRAFTRNDDQLLAIIERQRQNELRKLTPPGRS